MHSLACSRSPNACYCCCFCRRRLSARTRVEVVTDPCHPTQYNPIRPAFASGPDGEQHMLLAAEALPRGELLGLYWGTLVTHM
jgi:hypothetical protein